MSKLQLTAEQIAKFLSLTENDPREIIRAVRDYLKLELVRLQRAKGSPQTVEDKKEASRLYQRRWRAKRKVLKIAAL